jgi:hypothetical protein
MSTHFDNTSINLYSQLIWLRKETNPQTRGYRFEQILRELLPWSFRPPIAVSAQYEQLDAFFEWNGWHFVVEAKAKREQIHPGSHDWEDFALKVSNRRGQCNGLFCSLFEVSPSIYDVAKIQNRNGLTTIVVAGSIWDQLLAHKLPFSDFLRYMVTRAKASFSSDPVDIATVSSWCYEVEATSQKISRFCQHISSTFLRRYKMKLHERLYVARLVDRQIEEHVKKLRPNILREKGKHRRIANTPHLVTQDRGRPEQVFLVRDLSGSGKTTLAVQIALEQQSYFGMSRAAIQPDVDDVEDRLGSLGHDCGLHALIAVDRPLVYVVDSLDEAQVNPHKRREVLALLRRMESLNRLADEHGMRAYPLCLVFTVRDDYWKDWESTFEGVPAVTARRRFSNFSSSEFQKALENYSTVYNYRLTGLLDPSLAAVLAHPFSLQVFSEANEFKGDVNADAILDENVLAMYFDSKKGDILKRPISGFTEECFMGVCGRIAECMCLANENQITRKQFSQTIKSVYPHLSDYSESVLRVIASEQVLTTDPDDVQLFRMRHLRFLEYLVAYFIVSQLISDREPDVLPKLTHRLLGRIASILNVHEYIRHICVSSCPDVYKELTSYFSKSMPYVTELLNKQRSEISCGGRTSSLDLDTAMEAMVHGDSKVCWNTFFVVAAKGNRQSRERILDAFKAAWESNRQSPEAWKLLSKMACRGMILEESVLMSIVGSKEIRDWYVLLDSVYRHKCVDAFREAWDELGGVGLRTSLLSRGGEWHRVVRVLDIIISGQDYDPSVIE